MPLSGTANAQAYESGGLVHTKMLSRKATTNPTINPKAPTTNPTINPKAPTTNPQAPINPQAPGAHERNNSCNKVHMVLVTIGRQFYISE